MSMPLRSGLFAITAAFCGSLFGCAVAHGDTEEEPLVYSDPVALSRVCPQFVNPVCGKDGKTYSNYCFAGGSDKVDYNGPCRRDPGGSPKSCLTVTCATGSHCEMKGLGACTKTPCETHAVPVCIANAPTPPGPRSCATLTCQRGMHCEMKGLGACTHPPCSTTAIPVCIRN